MNPALGFVVLELFTSEGCSSCPPADKLLSALIREAAQSHQPVHALSFHVDYWNHLGWKDPFSREEFTGRQRAYGAALDARLYTPQLVVNGEREFVGSDGRRARQAIRDALGQRPLVEVQAGPIWDAASRMVTVEAQVRESGPGRILNLALVEDGLAVPVRRGENGGRTLVHDHVVRAFRTVRPDAEGKARLALRMPEGMLPEKSSLIAYVQDAETLHILGATATAITK
jgi:hypothetical protein